MHDMGSRPRNGLSLCAGGGGLDMGLMLAEPGFHTRCFVEWEEYPRSVLVAAQRAGYFQPAPIWDDVTTFDARPFAGAFDTLIAGYPCQPFSQAGQRRGENDERHLWPDIARIIRELGDGLDWVFLENVSGHVTLGLDTVLRELREMGFTPAAGLFSAGETGAPHERLRVFIVAHADGGNPGAERQQRGGEQRLQPESRPSGGGCAGLVMADASGARAAPWRPEPLGRSEGQPVESVDYRGPLPSFPPGPGDAAAWAAVIHEDAGAAPALGRGGTVQASQRYIASMDGSDAEAATQFGAGYMAGRRELSAVEREAAQVLGTPAVAAVRRLTDGMALRSRALRLLGNGVHPLAAAHAWRALAAAHGLRRVDMAAADDAGRAGTTEPDLMEVRS